MLSALTWGQAVATFMPTDDGLEYGLISVATSTATLILLGMALVEARLTSTFFLAFVAVGALSLVLQIESILRRRERLSMRARSMEPIDMGKR